LPLKLFPLICVAAKAFGCAGVFIKPECTPEVSFPPVLFDCHLNLLILLSLIPSVIKTKHTNNNPKTINVYLKNVNIQIMCDVVSSNIQNPFIASQHNVATYPDPAPTVLFFGIINEWINIAIKKAI